MFGELENGLCPGCSNQLEMEFTFHDLEQKHWKTFKVICASCNFLGQGDNDSFFILNRLSRDEAIKEEYSPSNQLIRTDIYTQCPANLYPEYTLPDGSRWVRRFMDKETLEKLIRPYPIK